MTGWSPRSKPAPARSARALRRELAAKAFARTAAYDGAIARWFARRQSEPLPERLLLGASRREVMRYGENPQQRAALYLVDGARDGIAQAVQLQGKALSYNNLADADAAFELVSELAAPAVAIVKHANPCGVAEGDALAAAYARALACDPQSAYGGIVAVNRPLDLATAEQIANLFTEVVVAPAADDGARTVLAARQNLRLLLTGEPARAGRGGARRCARSAAGSWCRSATAAGSRRPRSRW